MKFLILFLLIIFSAGILLAQESEEGQIESESEDPPNIIGVSFGYTFIPAGASEDATEATGYFVPTLGLEYARYLTDRIAVGALGELELGQYLVFDQDLPREKAWILMGQGSYKLPRNWIPYIGVGWEHDIHADLFVTRLGITKKYEFGNEWEWGFQFFWDMKRNYDTWSIMLFIGKLW